MKYEIEVVLKKGTESRWHRLLNPQVVDVCTYDYDNDNAVEIFERITDILTAILIYGEEW
jgi:hypothetical protein